MRIRQTRRTTVIIVVSVVVIAYVALSLFVFRPPKEITLRLPDYPAAAIVCKGRVTPGCALTAADRVKHDIAFIQTSAPFRPRVLLAFRGESIHELVSQDFAVSLYSQPAPIRVTGQIDRRVTVDGLDVIVRRGEYELSMEWTRNGVRYAIAVITLTRRQPPELKLAVSLLRRARYQEPSA